MNGQRRLALPDPPLVADGFSLRPWITNDRDVLASVWADSEIRRWASVPSNTDSAAAERWISGSSQRREQGLALDLVAVATDDGRILGEVGLSAFDLERRAAKIGWWTAAAERGRGVATAMVRSLTAWAHDGPLALFVVLAEVADTNRASVAVAESAGFDFLGSRPLNSGSDGGPELVSSTKQLVFASVRSRATARTPTLV
ncbi:MAG: GNAT family N-acetyltransferase [Acidimicrobiales bacterium]|nr:GNAT family N-acetyltransferase [Acidimicrobiales bacterium]